MRLKEYLDTNGIRQNWFAEQVGVDNQTFCRWVNGGRIPTKPTQKLIRILTKDQVKEEDWRMEDG